MNFLTILKELIIIDSLKNYITGKELDFLLNRKIGEN